MQGVVSSVRGGTGKKVVDALEGNTFAMRPEVELFDFTPGTKCVDKTGVAVE